MKQRKCEKKIISEFMVMSLIDRFRSQWTLIHQLVSAINTLIDLNTTLQRCLSMAFKCPRWITTIYVHWAIINETLQEIMKSRNNSLSHLVQTVAPCKLKFCTSWPISHLASLFVTGCDKTSLSATKFSPKAFVSAFFSHLVWIYTPRDYFLILC